MQCSYFDRGSCHSCTRMGEAYAAQLAAKDSALRDALARWPNLNWLPPFESAESHFRNKAKLMIGGTVQQPTLGILSPTFTGVDLTGCELYEAAVADSFPVLSAFIRRAQLTPFHVPSGRGELKNIIVTGAPAGLLMIRFVLRSTEPIVRIRKHLPWLRDQLPNLEVVTANLLPERKAVPEGKEEIVLGSANALPFKLGDITLFLPPQSFFQTNTAVARGLYETARKWTDDLAPRTVWDMFCGVGGFALYCARPGRRVTGVEISGPAVHGAKLAAADAGLSDDVDFREGDASQAPSGSAPELVIVNPPRRGIGQLSHWLNDSNAGAVLYSSCNPDSLVRDLRAMPAFTPIRARVFDMFPHTDHVETLVLLVRS
ncbi:methyltransferase domain-containing protein [Actinobaculum sp. 352]|nr:methyltransferase domain-containing protein [Actinobaculum sp. 352]